MKRNKVRLTESQLHQVIKESVKRVLKESYNDDDQYMCAYNDAMSDANETMSLNDFVLEETGIKLDSRDLTTYKKAVVLLERKGILTEEIINEFIESLQLEKKLFNQSVDSTINSIQKIKI